MYDRTIDLVVPQYRLMHNSVARLVRNHLARSADGAMDKSTGTVLDVGSGTGADTIRLLTEFPLMRVIALDLCEPMCRELQSKLHALDKCGKQISSRCHVIRGDVLAETGRPSELREFLTTDEQDRGYGAVVTALTVHHFEHAEKQEFYRRAFEILEPSGLFINADLFSFACDDLTSDALRFDLEWMKRQFADPDEAFEEASSLPAQDRQRLCEAWTNHYLFHNRLEPIEDSALGHVGQARMLQAAGFREVAVAYRYSLSGILWARK